MHMARLVEAIEETLNEFEPVAFDVSGFCTSIRRFWYAAAISGVAAAFAVLVWSGVVPFAARYTTASIADDGADTTGSTPVAIPAVITRRAKANGGFIFPDSASACSMTPTSRTYQRRSCVSRETKFSPGAVDSSLM